MLKTRFIDQSAVGGAAGENMKNTTMVGYINKNNQKNFGYSGEPGSDHMQKYYFMKCLNCNYQYKANGSDIWLKKCPKCQGGKL